MTDDEFLTSLSQEEWVEVYRQALKKTLMGAWEKYHATGFGSTGLTTDDKGRITGFEVPVEDLLEATREYRKRKGIT